MRSLHLLGVPALLLASGPAFAAPIEIHEGVELTVKVVDPAGAPIATAVVRSPLEGGIRHTVNHRTGEWATRALYPEDGSAEEVLFYAGDELILDVSAPGYMGRIFQYDVVAFRNLVTVVLDPLGTEVTTRKQRRRARKDLEQMDWVALLTDQDCGSSSRLATIPAPVPLDASVVFDPDTMVAIGDLRHPDPLLTAAFSTQLLAMGVDHSAAAMAWADLAVKEAKASLEGDAFVKLIDDMYRVRAVAANVRWQALEAERLAAGRYAQRSENERARKQAAQIAEEWVDWTEAAETDRSLARALCYSSSEHTGRCE